MKKYKVLITEHNYGNVIVEAKDEQEARDKAKEKIWGMDSLSLSTGIWEDTNVEVYDVEEEPEWYCEHRPSKIDNICLDCDERV